MSIYLFAHTTTSAGNIVNFSDSKTDHSNKHMKLSIICFKVYIPYMWLYVSTYVCFLTHFVQICRLALWPCAQIDEWELVNQEGIANTQSTIQASFIHVCVCTCVCLSSTKWRGAAGHKDFGAAWISALCFSFCTVTGSVAVTQKYLKSLRSGHIIPFSFLSIQNLIIVLLTSPKKHLKNPVKTIISVCIPSDIPWGFAQKVAGRPGDLRTSLAALWLLSGSWPGSVSAVQTQRKQSAIRNNGK